MNGFLGVGAFAEKAGVTEQTIYNWIRLAKIPFKLEGERYFIPEFDGLNAPCVVKKRARVFTLSEPPKDGTLQVVVGGNLLTENVDYRRDGAQVELIQKDERLFLVARQQAQGFISRARCCRDDGRHEAEAELLWMAIECFGFKP